MEVKKLHKWDVDKDEGKKIQEELRNRVIIKPISKQINIICGIDSSYRDDEIISCAVLCKYPELELIDIIKIKGKTNF
ncbi:MAG: hypothetical protein NC827_07300, partial [Candidatus Omnitrophica bacterium]|nr:hypothetical protein [Candidatus Omnitrophota bacterium]MCM8803097.1 hypothetical protein [Candidatus Omnitrophota bacterium]